jgi:hypothetical protein
MRAEIIFNTPDTLVAIIFPGFQWESSGQAGPLKIGGLPYVFAQELKKRWDFFDNQVGPGAALPP